VTLTEVLADVETFALEHGLARPILIHAEAADGATFLVAFRKTGDLLGADNGTRVLALPVRFDIRAPGTRAMRAVLEEGQQLRRVD
jgi:hypothetical protein